MTTYKTQAIDYTKQTKLKPSVTANEIEKIKQDIKEATQTMQEGKNKLVTSLLTFKGSLKEALRLGLVVPNMSFTPIQKGHYQHFLNS